MDRRKRKRTTLASIRASRSLIDPEVQADLMDIPAFLDRKLWTEEDYERNDAAWDRIMKEERERRNIERAKTDKEIFAKVRRARQIKTIKRIKKERRKDLRDERKARQIRRERIKGEHNEAVLEALAKGPATAAQIAKRLGFDRRDVSKALRRLMTVNKADKLSAKVYSLPEPVTSQRASDKPKRKRTRLRDLR